MISNAAHYTSMTTVRLYGPLRKFGKSYQLAVSSPLEAIKALALQIPGFEKFFLDSKLNGLEFAIFRGKKNLGEKEVGRHGQGEIIIAPVIRGSKRAGILQTVVGVAVIALAWWNPLGWSAATATATAMAGGSAGIANAAGGVIQMLSPQASSLRTSASPENRPSYAFGSAKKTTASGNNVPIYIGKRRLGGAIISASILAEDKV